MDIEFSGLDQLVSRLKAMPKQVVEPAARNAVRAGAKVIQAAIIEAAPVQALRRASSNSLEVGELKGNITISARSVDGEAVATVGPGKRTEHVAEWVEYGHRKVRGGYSRVLPNGKTRGPGKASDVDVPAHPFIRPAFEESAAGAEEAMKASLLDEITKDGL